MLLPYTRSFFTYRTLYGRITLCDGVNGITEVHFGNVNGAQSGNTNMSGTGVGVYAGAAPKSQPSERTNKAANEIQAYLSGKCTTFSTPLELHGSNFDLLIWKAVQDISYGTTMRIRDLRTSLKANNISTSATHIGRALNNCPCPLFIPIHRVECEAGTPLGNAHTINIYRGLIQLEKRFAQK